MKVLKPTTDTQIIKLIPRDYETTLSVSLRDDQTNVTVDYTPTVTKENDYLVYEGVFDLKESHFYDFVLGRDFNLWQQNNLEWQASTELWDDTQKEKTINVVDKIFCTDQTVDQSSDKEYTVNKGVYTTDNSFDNEYVIYEAE